MVKFEFLSIFCGVLFVSGASAGYTWKGYSYDPDNFMCAKFNDMCGDVLDDIGCKEDRRTVEGSSIYLTIASIPRLRVIRLPPEILSSNDESPG